MINAPGQRRTRDISLDSVRGVAIFGVVTNHVVRGIRDARLSGHYDVFLHQLDLTFYLPELVLFAFVSGLFVPGSLRHSTSATYLRTRLLNLGYLYLVWTIAQGSAEVFSSSVKNTPTTWTEVLQLWNPLGHLWFLPWLAIATVITVVARPWESRLTWRVGVTVLAVILSVTMWGVDGPAFYQRGIGLTMFMLLGAAVTRARWQRSVATLPTLPLTVVGIALTGGYLLLRTLPDVTLPTAPDPTRTPLSIAAGVAFAIVACLGVLALGTTAGRSTGLAALTGALAYLGRQSLPIYVSHIIFAAGTRVVMVEAGVSAPLLLFGVCLTGGLAGPLLLERITRPVPVLFIPVWELGPIHNRRTGARTKQDGLVASTHRRRSG